MATGFTGPVTWNQLSQLHGVLRVTSGSLATVHSTQQALLGTLAADSSGNLFLYVDFQESMVAGEVVLIDSAYLATQITNTSKGWVGVVVGTVSASDRFGWAQIYGAVTALGTSGITSGGPLIVTATTDTGHFDEATTSPGVYVFGAWSTAAASTATTTVVPASVTVTLNFPYVLGYLQEIMTS